MSVRERRVGATAVLTLDDPARRNALGPAVKTALADALRRAVEDPAVRVLVLEGAGGHFSGGGDLAAMRSDGFAAGRRRMAETHALLRLLLRSPKPLIAAAEGWCAGGALGLLLCCDTIVAGAGARFVASFPKVGLVPDFGLLHSLPRRVGEGRARQILLYAEPLGAEAALACGLVDRLAPEGGALEVALARAEALAALAPASLSLIRERLWQGVEDTLDWERDAQAALFQTADHQEGRAAFLEKRAPNFGGS